MHVTIIKRKQDRVETGRLDAHRCNILGESGVMEKTDAGEIGQGTNDTGRLGGGP